jgi:hypothetical protein
MAVNLGLIASQISGHLENNSFESIQTVTLATSQSTISFNSIPSTYKHLQLRMLTRSNQTGVGSEWILAQFNSDSTSGNYSFHYMGGDGANPATGYSLSPTGARIGLHWSASNPSNVFHGNIVDILDYTNSNKTKTVTSLVGSDTNSGTYNEVFFLSNNWHSTSTISSITLTSNWTFGAYSKFALYGIKG